MISSHQPPSRSKCTLVTLAHLLSNASYFVDSLESAQFGGLIVIVPSSIEALDQVIHSTGSQEELLTAETKLMEMSTSVPVYFLRESPNVLAIYNLVESSSSMSSINPSNLQESVVNSIQSEFYHVSVTSAVTAVVNPIVSVIEGASFAPTESSLPTLVVSAFYDSASLIPALSFGGDSNASGLIALLELARILFRLRSSINLPCKANVVFLASGGGKLNYWGTKKWIEEKLESHSVLSETLFTLSLESIGDRPNEGVLYMHTSKEPKVSSPSAAFFNALNSTGMTQLITKKISLSDDFLSWEHERFASRRLPAFTISSISHAKEPLRSSIFDTCSSLNVENLYKNIIRISEAVVSLLYDSPDALAKVSSIASKDSVRAYLKFACQTPRSQISLLTSNVGRPDFVSSLGDLFKKVTRSVTVYDFKMDKKSQSEFTLYEPTKATLNLYKAKSPLFELLLFLLICTYLAFLLFIIKVSHSALSYSSLTNLHLSLPFFLSSFHTVVQIYLLFLTRQLES